MEFQAKWIQAYKDMGNICPIFKKTWEIKGTVKRAELFATALGRNRYVFTNRTYGGKR